MKQDAFERRYEAAWNEFSEWIGILAGKQRATETERRAIGEAFPEKYRAICQHLALARARRYGPAVQLRLNQLALDGHQYLYRTHTSWRHAVGTFFATGFPLAFRRHWRFMLAATVLFYGPLVALVIATRSNSDIIYSLLPIEQVAEMEQLYDPDNRKLGRERQSDSDLYMFGFYIYNNIGIGFRTFAGGLLFGIGSVFFLLYNGLVIGAVAGHLSGIGYGETFWPFVVGHGAFELTAIVIFGAAGLMLGYAALAPGQHGRWRAIQLCAREALPLVYGGTAFLVLAAFVEAFWSSTTWPSITTKFVTGAVLWLAVSAYLGIAGRHEP